MKESSIPEGTPLYCLCDPPSGSGPANWLKLYKWYDGRYREEDWGLRSRDNVGAVPRWVDVTDAAFHAYGNPQGREPSTQQAVNWVRARYPGVVQYSRTSPTGRLPSSLGYPAGWTAQFLTGPTTSPYTEFQAVRDAWPWVEPILDLAERGMTRQRVWPILCYGVEGGGYPGEEGGRGAFLDVIVSLPAGMQATLACHRVYGVRGGRGTRSGPPVVAEVTVSAPMSGSNGSGDILPQTLDTNGVVPLEDALDMFRQLIEPPGSGGTEVGWKRR